MVRNHGLHRPRSRSGRRSHRSRSPNAWISGSILRMGRYPQYRPDGPDGVHFDAHCGIKLSNLTEFWNQTHSLTEGDILHQVRKNLVREDGTKRFTINKESADYTIYVHESRASAASRGENTDGGQSQAVVASEHGSNSNASNTWIRCSIPSTGYNTGGGQPELSSGSMEATPTPSTGSMEATPRPSCRKPKPSSRMEATPRAASHHDHDDADDGLRSRMEKLRIAALEAESQS